MSWSTWKIEKNYSRIRSSGKIQLYINYQKYATEQEREKITKSENITWFCANFKAKMLCCFGIGLFDFFTFSFWLSWTREGQYFTAPHSKKQVLILNVKNTQMISDLMVHWAVPKIGLWWNLETLVGEDIWWD